jgi:hypothetical protein
MSGFDLRNFVADKAVAIAPAAICVADIGATFGRPHWPFYGLALVVTVFAILVGSRRAIPRLMFTKEQLGFTRNRDLLLYQIEMKGRPRGYLLLSGAWFIGAVLTGLRMPYVMVVLASGGLLAAWAGDRRQYPVDLSKDPVG